MSQSFSNVAATRDEYRAIFEASPDGCLVVDVEGTISRANPRMEELFGWTLLELRGQRVELLVPEALRTVHLEHRARYAGDPHSRPMGVGLELRGRRKDGTTFPVEISLSPWVVEGEGLRVICTVRDVSDYRRLQSFSEGALRATEEERRRIARELHDDTAQRLATLVLRVRRLAMEADVDARHSLFEEVRREIIETTEGVNRMARGLRPPELEEVGLVAALTAHLRGLREATQFVVEARLEPVDAYLSTSAKLAVYRIVQECVSNARRHANATNVEVRLFPENETIVAEVADDGRGFRSSDALDDGDGLGLIGMQERAAMIGARLIIDSAPGRGTVVRVTIPTGGGSDS
jgi:PAS domain S-box-containing protein